MTDITDNITDLIYRIEDEADLDFVSDVLRDHRNTLQERSTRKLMASVVEGETRVRIKETARLKPRYILGATGTVAEKRISKIGVRLDVDIPDPYGKWAGRIAVIPAHDLEVI